MTTITNNAGIPLALAVWLVHDEYDYANEPNYISATSLMKPIRQLVLANRIPPEERSIDLEEMIASSLGNAIHDSMEKAWTAGYQTNLRKLGYPQHVIDKVLVNPTDEELDAIEGAIPVYLEQREFRQHNGYLIGGKYDQVTEGIVNDIKSTSAYSWVLGGKDEDYQLQGSIYRWLDAARERPRITEDFMRINFVFTDWQKMQAKSNPAYPQRRVEQKEIMLLPLKETEEWIDHKLNQIQKFQKANQDQLPECTSDELWQSDPVYKYYSDPAKVNVPKARATKNFDDMGEARKFMAEKGGKGIIITKPGEPKRCGYCPAFDICEQRKALGL